MKHFSEHELIAYQLGESAEGAAIGEHLETCLECASVSESIAETLRVFSAEPVPQANVDHAWQRLRGSLPGHAAPVRRRWRPAGWLWLAPVAALLLVVSGAMLQVARTAGHPGYAHHRPGPLTEEPAGAVAGNARAADGMAGHLDSAERLLTEVNHASGPLDETARAQTHALLLSNAMYVKQASASGDLAQVALLESLGRVLTTLDHEPPRQDKEWHVRLEMHTDGLLLDLRILQQNDTQPGTNEREQGSKRNIQ